MAERRTDRLSLPLTPPDARERWARVSALLDTALETPPDSRDAFVRSIGDPALREEVARLLDACARAEHEAALPTGAAPAQLFSDDDDEAAADDAPFTLEGRIRGALADRYLVEREVARGGMAVVYSAQDMRHERPVAIKVLLPRLATPAATARFLREIHLMARLAHPHVLPLLDSGDADGLPFLVMPWVSGESLRGRLAREGMLPVRDAMLLAREVADALDCAHRHGMVHRDVKPDNILLQDGHAVVADFGVARATSAALEAPLTGTGIVVGTPAYMSPEQAAGERALDGRSDVHALGCVLYEMLTGAPPYSGRSRSAVIAQVVAAPPPSARARRADVSPALDALVRRALAKAPEDRHASAAAMRAELDALLDGSASALHRSSGSLTARIASWWTS